MPIVWEAVGPFPSGMREHPLLASPLHAFPHKYQDADVDFAFRKYGEGDWPSELPTGGRAGWTKFEEIDEEVVISYPDVRWEQLRADHGWAALQYSVMLRRPVTISGVCGNSDLTSLRVDAFQAVEYAFISKDEPELPVVWYAGDVYAFGQTRSGIQVANRYDKTPPYSTFAREVSLKPGDYVLLVRAIYECRMFGDPGHKPPEIKVGITLSPEYSVDYPEAVMPDVIDGWLMGSWASILSSSLPLFAFDSRSSVSGKDVVVVTVRRQMCNGVWVSTEAPVHIVPGQIRPISLRLEQDERLDDTVDKLSISVHVITGGKVRHRIYLDLSLGWVGPRLPFHVTFPSPAVDGHPPALVSGCTVVPPHEEAGDSSQPPVILALHGAGVDYRAEDWIEAMPCLPGMWAVLPSGRNEWGEDWHGGSMADAWAARDALNPILKRVGIKVSLETVLIGHSNGGQGVWHCAARYPDRIRGVVAVAGYLKIQDYVPYTETTSAHYADPALLGILHASLAPYNNDLYASNLASVPVLAVHGADDDNVPPRHGRSHAALVASWAGESNVKFVEVPNVGHVWPGVLRHPSIIDFLTKLPPKRTTEQVRNAGFTLATANPDETGPKAGIRIAELAVPGRLARLDVNAPQWKHRGPLDLHGTNIRRIEITGWASNLTSSLSYINREWRPTPRPATRAYGPMIRLLSSSGPVSIIIGRDARHRSLALRYAHDLRVYHRLDAVIIDESDALKAIAEATLSPGSVVVIGRPEDNRFASWLIAQERVPLKFPARGILKLADRLVWENGTGIIALHPHPTNERGLAVLVAGNNELGLELAARLLPLRTGVPVPDWVVVSPRCRWQGAGGMVGAGFWDGQWGWSEGMSWMDRE